MARKIEVHIVGDASSYSRALKDASNQSSVFSKGLLTIGKAAAIGLGALGAVSVVAGKKMVDMASDAAEVQSKLEVTFGRALPQLTKNIDKFADATGASRFALREQVADMGALLVPLSESKQAAAEMSAQFVKLATDLGSFNNVPVDEALLAIRSGLVGEAEPLRRFGVLLNEAAVKAEGLRLGLVKGKEAMSEQEKVQARASLIMKQTTLAQGDATRTAGSFANQMKKLHNSIADAATAMGQELLPILLPLLQRFNAFLTGLFGQTTIKAKLRFVWEGLESVALDLFNALKDEFARLFVGQTFFSAQEKQVIRIDPVFDVSFENLKNTLDEGLRAALGGITLGDVMQTVFNGIIETTKLNWKVISTIWLEAWRLILDGLQAVGGKVVGFFGDLRQTFSQGIDRASAALRSGVAQLPGIVGAALAQVVARSVERWGEFLGAIRNVAGAAAAAAVALGTRVVTGVVTGLAGIGTRVLNKLNDIIRFIATTAQNAFAAAVAIGSGIISGILSGLSGLASRVGSFIGSEVRKGIEAGKALLGIKSPSTVTRDEIGVPLGQGVIDGWIRSSAALPSTMSESIRKAIEKARAQIEASRERLGTAFDGMAARILRAFDAETSAIRTASEQRIDEISQRREMEDLLDRQAQAQQRLNQAIAEGGDVASAQRDLDRATEDIALVDLKKKAEQERIQLDSQNEERRLKLEQRLENEKKHWVAVGATTKTAVSRIVGIMKAFDIDFADAGELLGKAFANALQKAITGAASAAAAVDRSVPGRSSINATPGLTLADLGSTGGTTIQFNNYAPISSEKDFEDMVRSALNNVTGRQGFA